MNMRLIAYNAQNVALTFFKLRQNLLRLMVMHLSIP